MFYLKLAKVSVFVGLSLLVFGAGFWVRDRYDPQIQAVKQLVRLGL